MRTAQVSADDARGLKIVLADLARALQSAEPFAVARPEARAVAAVAGMIMQVKGRYGQNVRKGDILMRLDDRDQKMQVQLAEAEMRAAEAAAQQVGAQLDRVRKAFASKEAGRKEVDEAAAASGQAQAQVLMRRAAVELARTNLERCTITSPVDGTIADMPLDENRFEEGQLVAPGEVVAVIAARADLSASRPKAGQ